MVDFLLFNVENILINGTQLILDKVFKFIGFDKLNDDMLNHLVTAHQSQVIRKNLSNLIFTL